MAADTATKRFSLLGFGAPIPTMVTVPSGTIGAAQRADLLFLYSGITLGAAVLFDLPACRTRTIAAESRTHAATCA